MGLKSKIWIALLVGKMNEFLNDNSWFLRMGINMDAFVENESINFTHKGTIPGVTKNPIYPLTQINRTDIPDSIPLAPYATDEFVLPKIDLHALPYKKKKTVLVDHRQALLDTIVTEGIWNVSPFEHTPKTPIITATGAPGANGHKLIIGADIINLRKELNKAFPALKMAPWALVLDTDSYWNLAATDEILKGQMIQRRDVGDVNLKGINYHGFELQEDNRTPYYDSSDKRLPFGSTPNLATDAPSATAFVANKTFAKAMGKTEFFDKSKDSSLQADLGSFLTHAYVGPLSLNLQDNLTFMGAILRKA